MQGSPRSNKSFDSSSNDSLQNKYQSTAERYRIKRDRYYGQFQVHDEQFASNMRSMGLTAKLLGSLGQKEMEQVFNGVFYNLDAQVELEYQYQNQDELYEFFEKIGEGAFSNVRRALFLPTGEELAVKILKSEYRETSQIISLVK